MSITSTSTRRRRIVAWAWLAWLALLQPAPAGAAESGPPNYFLRSWKTDDGLPDNAVTAVVQTREGYLWLGTYAGLARFDGARFVVFNSAQEPGSAKRPHHQPVRGCEWRVVDRARAGGFDVLLQRQF